MATVITSARGTPSFAPPPTQNTAPVHEFRCLFTHDAHKKAKKWHDGSVHFHTFNRRVMVYDEGKNFVGDHHYRPNEDFDEGLELRLDRGILVDVGERLGETQTDLAPLLDRKKDDASPQPPRRARLVAAATQQHPKPLSQILGTQGRIGRARPAPSPYEQRQALAPVQPAEPLAPPPPKRQKVDVPGKENRPAGLPPAERPSPKPVARRESDSASRSIAATRETVMEFQDVVDLSSDEEIAKSAQKQPQRPNRRSVQSESRGQKSGPPLTREQASSPKRPDPPPRKQLEPRLTDASPKPAQEVGHSPRDHALVSLSSNRLFKPSTSSRSGTTKLLLRSQKPRRKLLYKVLLSSSKANAASSNGAPSREGLFSDPKLSANSTGGSAKDAPITNRPPQERPSISRRGSIEEPALPPSSPLFIPEEISCESPSEGPGLSQDGLEAHMLKTPETSKADEKGQEDQEMSTEKSPVASGSEPMPPNPKSPPNPIPTSSWQMLPPPVPQPSALQNTPSRPQRAFRRVRSENDAVQDAEEDFTDLGGFSYPPPSFLARAKASPVGALKSQSKSPVKLRRTTSDSAAMELDSERVTSCNIEPFQEAIGEAGPWTATEAYLLFEWWPPGKTKPDYGVPADIGRSPEQYGARRPAITTARDMLRDEINVL